METDRRSIGRLILDAAKWIPLAVLAVSFISERTEQKIAITNIQNKIEALESKLSADNFVKYAEWRVHRERDIAEIWKFIKKEKGCNE